MGVIIIREMVGTSPKSWSDAARQAVATDFVAAANPAPGGGGRTCEVEISGR
jgi:hypothetical protein